MDIWPFVWRYKFQYWVILTTLLSIFSFILSILISIDNNFLYFLILMIPFLIILFWIIISYIYLIKIKGIIDHSKGKNELSLKIIYGDLFEENNRNYKIISIDEDMNWEVNDEIVSSNTLHGKILLKLSTENIDIKNYFNNLYIENFDETNEKMKLLNGKNLIDKKRRIIFIPLTKFDKNNKEVISYE